MLLIVVAVTFLLAWSAESLVRYIPFSVEVSLAGKYAAQADHDDATTAYLQKLAARLAAAQNLPQDMKITVHYVDEDTINAFATLGGHIVVFRGLLEKIPDENTLAMVISHEIAHIQHRHPIMSLGRGLVVGLALAALSGLSDIDIAGDVLGEAGLLTVLKFSREQELEADRTALAALAKVYGHIGGANELFKMFQDVAVSSRQPPQLLSSHPHTERRIEAINTLAAEYGWQSDGTLTPLPKPVEQRLQRHAKASGSND